MAGAGQYKDYVVYEINGATGTAVLKEKHDFEVPQSTTKPSKDNSDVSEPTNNGGDKPNGDGES